MAFFQATNLWVEATAENVAALILDAPGKFNFLDRTVLDEINQALTVIEADRRFQWCLVRSKKSGSFCHGVTATTWNSLQTPQQWDAFHELGRCVCERLTQLRMPTVAVIDGPCLGSGLELALACDWRIAVDSPHTEIAFSELEFGLIPSWGTLGRLPELIGLENSLQLLLGRKKLSAFAARSMGLVDDVAMADTNDPPTQSPRKRGAGARQRRTWRQALFESTALGRGMILRGAERILRRRVPDDMPAPWVMFEAMRVQARQGAAAANEYARDATNRLRTSAAFTNLLRFELLHETRRAAGADLLRPKRIGILGATPLALHLAAQAAVKGCHVVLREKDELTVGMAALQLVKTLQEGVERGDTPAQFFESNVNRIRPTVTWNDFEEVELVIDASHGTVESQSNLMRELESKVSDDAVIACLRPWRALKDWQPHLRRPERALLMHFPPPVGRTPLIEILRGELTSNASVDRIRSFVAMLRKTPVVVQEQHGGLLLRILGAGWSEALHLLEEGQPLERLDQLLSRFGMEYRPLEQLDLMGIDEFAMAATRMQLILNEDLVKNAIVQHLVKQRWLGFKSGVGFYRHAKGTVTPNRALARWLQSTFAANIRPMSNTECEKTIQERLVCRMVNEAFRCLDDGVVTGSDDIDLALMLVGWAPHRGGPCHFAEQVGYSAIVTQLAQLTQQIGPRFTACEVLLRLAKQ